jgi:outer membrane protein
MKRLKTLLFATALFVGATSFLAAQDKLAHVDRQDIVKSLPDYKTAQQEIEKLGQTYQAEMKSNVEELETKLKLYNAEAAQKTDEENANRMREVEGMKQSIAQYQQQAQQELQKKELDLLEPIVKKVDEAIKKVARNKGYQYVIEKAAFIMAEGTDLTSDVKKDLGVL